MGLQRGDRARRIKYMTYNLLSLPNPYASSLTLSLAGIEFLVAASIVCFIVGLLLAEQSTLNNTLSAIERVFQMDSLGKQARESA